MCVCEASPLRLVGVMTGLHLSGRVHVCAHEYLLFLGGSHCSLGDCSTGESEHLHLCARMCGTSLYAHL